MKSDLTLVQKAWEGGCNIYRIKSQPKLYYRGEACIKCTGKFETCPIRRVNNKGATVCLCFTDFTDEMEKEYLKLKKVEEPKPVREPTWQELAEAYHATIRKRT